MDFDIYYFKALSELEKVKSKRSYNERTIFDSKGKKMRRKLEKGFLNGVDSAIKVLKRVKKEFNSEKDSETLEHKERTFVQ